MPIIVCAKSTPKRGKNELHWIWGTFPTSILCTKQKISMYVENIHHFNFSFWECTVWSKIIFRHLNGYDLANVPVVRRPGRRMDGMSLWPRRGNAKSCNNYGIRLKPLSSRGEKLLIYSATHCHRCFYFFLSAMNFFVTLTVNRWVYWQKEWFLW